MQQSKLEMSLNPPERNAEVTSVMRTNKARAQAAQFLMQDNDNTAPLPPLDPSQRISLHRQLRSRYNPSQIPFSALSCSKYITADDVAQLATVFHQFNLFSPVATKSEEPVQLRSQRASITLTSVSGRSPSLTTMLLPKTEPTTTTRGKLKLTTDARGLRKTAPPSPAAAATRRSSNASAASTTAAVAGNWRRGECLFEGNGMTLLHDVAEPPPPRWMSPTGPSSPSYAVAQTQRRPLLGKAGSPVPAAPLSSFPAAGPVSTTSMISATAASTSTAAGAATAAETRDLAEPFTAESGDCAVTVDWLVEVLLEMILVNAEAAHRRGRAASGGDEAAAGGDSGDQRTLSGTAGRPSTATGVARNGELNSTVNALGAGLSVSMAAGAAAAGASTNATSYQTRGRETRADLLLSVRAELLHWAEQLQQTCDQREHLAAWQQCALQEEVLDRYRACVVHVPLTASAAPLHGSPLLHTPETFPHAMSRPAGGTVAGSLLLPPQEFGSALVAMPSTATEASNNSPTSFPAGAGAALRGRRANVSWQMPNSVAHVPQSPRTGPKSEAISDNHSSSCNTSIHTAAPTQEPRGIFVSPTSRKHTVQPHDVPHHGVAADPLGITGGQIANVSPMLLASSEASIDSDNMGSLSACGNSGMGGATETGGVVHLYNHATTINVAPIATGGAAAAAASTTEASYLAAKARPSVPKFKDLLLHPSELNHFLWESPAACEIAMEEEMRAQQQQHARSTRSAQPSHAGATEALMQSAGDLSRVASQNDVPPRALGQPGASPQSQQQHRRRRAAVEQHLVCWSDVASNLLMGLETTWTTQQQDQSYVRVPTALLEDVADIGRSSAVPGQPLLLSSLAATTRPLPGAVGGTDVAATGGPAGALGATAIEADDDDDDDEDSDEAQALSLGAAAKGGQCRRRRLHRAGDGTDAASLQQRAMLLSSLGAAAESALRTLHAQAADHVVVSPSQKYFVTSSKDGMLKVWETTRGQFVSTILNVEQAWVLHMAFLHGGEYLLVATSAAEITVVNFPSGGVVVKLRGCTSLATAIPFVKQPSTVYTQRYGLKPGECGHHKPVAKQGTTVAEYHAAAAVRLDKQVESESEPIAARPLVGYVTPTSAFYEEELGHLFFGTLSGMVGCVNLSEPLSRSGLLAAAAGVRWSGPLYVYDSVYAHPDSAAHGHRETNAGAPGATAASPSAASAAIGATVPSRSLASTTHPSRSTNSGSTPAGLLVNGVFYCGVGHCVISSDCAGSIMRTPFAAAADTLVVSLGVPVSVMDTDKPIRFMACCSGGRRFVTVHSDRRALLWNVGRTITELVHQYPQEAYDIVDACFIAHPQQVALLMADRSVHIFDERGTRPISSIHPPRGFSSRVEDMASITLKYSADDGEGCLAYVPSSRRLVCGLRGPVMYEPAPQSVTHETTAADAVVENAKPRRGSGLIVLGGRDNAAAGLKAVLGDASPSRPSSALARAEGSPAFLMAAVAPPSLASSPNKKAAFTTAKAAERRLLGQPQQQQPPQQRKASVSSLTSAFSETSELEERAQERARRRVRRQQINAALLNAQQRLLPHQTHTSAVVGLLLNAERHELHTISTDSWVVWNYETGVRTRVPMQVPAAAERELALPRRACRLTCCAWSSSGHTRLLLGTRGSRVLTLDAAVGSVVSVTEPLVSPLRRRGETTLDDTDISVIASCGTRTLICSGRVCEVRRYELTSALLPSGEERFVSMQVQLPAVAALPEAADGATTTTSITVPGAAATAGSAGGASPTAGVDHGRVKGTSRGGGATSSRAHASGHAHAGLAEQASSAASTTITACCVVRESFLCLGTSDTQLYFYRMVDRSSPVQVEVLRDMNGEPDVGRVMSLHYVHNKTQDMILAVVDTGALYIYSYTLQRIVARYNFPCLGTSATATGPAATRKNRATLHTQQQQQQQQHYLTSVSLTDDWSSNAVSAGVSSVVLGVSQRQLTLCCGDSAGYVHVIALAGVLVEAAAAATAAAEHGSRFAVRHRELRVALSFRAAIAGVSAVAALRWGAVKAPSSAEAMWEGSGNVPPPAPPAATATEVSLSAALSANSLVIVAGSFVGNVRVFCVVGRLHSYSGAPQLSTTAVGMSFGPNATLPSTSTRGVPLAFTASSGASILAPTMSSGNGGGGGSGSPAGTLTSTSLPPSDQRPTLRVPRFSDEAAVETAPQPPAMPTMLSTPRTDGNGNSRGGPISTLLSPSFNLNKPTGLTSAIVSLVPAEAAGRSAQLANAAYTANPLGSVTNMHTATMGTASVGLRFVPLTVGLCGLDTWDLRDADTFSDVKRMAFMLSMETEWEEGEGNGAEEHGEPRLLRLPTILDDDDDTANVPQAADVTNAAAAEGGEAAPWKRASSTARTHTAGSGGGGGPDEGAVLLREVLKQSKRRLAQFPPAPLAAAAAVDGREERPPSPQRLVSGFPNVSNTKAASLPPSQRVAPSLNASADSVFADTNPLSMSVTARGAKSSMSRSDSARVHSAPPPLALGLTKASVSEADVTAPVAYRPHTIGELVSGADPNPTKRLTLPQIKAVLTEITTAGVPATTESASSLLFKDNNASRNSMTALTSSVGPQPRSFPFKNQQNPLLRTYPVALLRQMGVLHPQDRTPDVDPVTGQPAQISAEEAFRPWERTPSEALLSIDAVSEPPVASPLSDGGDPLSPPSFSVVEEERPSVVDTVAASDRVTFTTSSSSSTSGEQEGRRGGPLGSSSGSGDTSSRRHDDEHSSGSGGEEVRAASSRSGLGLPPILTPAIIDSARRRGRGRDSSASERGTEAPDSDVEPADVEHTVEAPSSSSGHHKPASSPTSNDTANTNTNAEDEDLQEVSVFLTESNVPAHRVPPSPRPRFAKLLSTTPKSVTTGGRSTGTTATTPHSTATTAVPNPIAASECETTLSATAIDEDAHLSIDRVSVSMPDVLILSDFSASPMAAAANMRWNVAQQRITSPNSGREETLTARQRRSQASYLGADAPSRPSPSLSPQKPATTQRELTLLRNALQNVDPQVLAMREDQMMLAHAASQLDRCLRRPTPATPSPRSAASAQTPSATAKSDESAGVGEYTARLLRVWRERTGDAAVDATAALVLQHGTTLAAHADEDGEGPASNAASVMTRRSAAGSTNSKRGSSREGLGSGPTHRPKSLKRLPSNAMMAAAASRQSVPGAGFGLNLFALTLPNEPPQLAPRRGARGTASARAAVGGSGRASAVSAGASAATTSTTAAAAGATPVVTPPRSARTLPSARMQQDLHPITIHLPSTLQKDEGERMWLRRFETAINDRGAKR